MPASSATTPPDIARAVARAAELQAEFNERWQKKTGRLRSFDGFQIEFVGFRPDGEPVFCSTVYSGARYVGTAGDVTIACRSYLSSRVRASARAAAAADGEGDPGEGESGPEAPVDDGSP